MDKQTYDRGLEIRKSVLGAEFVEKAINSADDFNRPLQVLVTEYCWGAVWGREGLSKKERSMLNLAMISALNRPHALKVHVGASDLAVIVPVSGVVQMLPLSFGGLGVREGAFSVYFTGIGLPVESALLLSLSATALIMLFSLSGVPVYLGRGHRAEAPGVPI